MLRYQLAILVFSILLFLGAVVNGTPTPPRRLAVRKTTTDSLIGRKGGVFFKDYQQTTCGLAFLTNQAALVTADCFNFNGKSVDRTIIYQVYTNPSFNGVTVGFKINDIIVHPEYNPETKANNVAAVNFNLGGTHDWDMDTAIDLNAWEARIYTQRHLKNLKGMVWDFPDYSAEETIEQDNTCSDLSPIYGENTDKFTCTRILAAPLMTNSTACKIPYPVLYAQMGDELYQAGLFSHSVVKGGDSLCENNEVRSYYTLIGDYLAFAEKALDKKFKYHGKDDASTPQSDPNYSMKSASKSAPDGTAMLSGDFYNPKAAVIQSPTSSDGVSATTGVDKEAEDSTDGELDSDVSENSDMADISDKAEVSDALDSQNDSSDSKESSKRTTIIAAVCGSVGGLILLAIILLGIRWYRGHLRKVHDPYQAPSAHDQLEEMFENSENDRPPGYKFHGEDRAEPSQNPNAISNASPTSSRYSFNFPYEKD